MGRKTVGLPIAPEVLCAVCEENVQVPVEIRGGRCRAASRVSVPDTFLTLMAFELSRWRGGRCCMGFLGVLLTV